MIDTETLIHFGAAKVNELTKRGINALKSGDRAAARTWLAEAVRQQPDDVQAWLWLSGAVESDNERAACLRRVLSIDPGNEAAARGLALIASRRKQQQPAETQAQPPEIPQKETEPEAAAETVAAADMGARENAPAEEPAPSAEDRPTGTPVPGTVESAPPAQPAARAAYQPEVRAKAPSQPALSDSVKVVFTARPSLVPSLLSFWLFVIGIVVISSLLRQAQGLPVWNGVSAGVYFTVLVAVILAAVTFYSLIRNLLTRYRVTNRYIRMPYRRRFVTIPVEEIYDVECTQHFFQRLAGTGNLTLHAAVHGQLDRLRMKNISNCRQREAQIRELIAKNAAQNSVPGG